MQAKPPNLARREQGEGGENEPDRLRSAVSSCARVSKTDGSQSPDLRRDALEMAGVDAVDVYRDVASGVRDDPAGLDSCQRALRKGDVLVVWRLDRLGRNLARLADTVQDLSARGVGLLAGDEGRRSTPRPAGGRLVFGIFAALAEFEGELVRAAAAVRPMCRQRTMSSST